MTRDRHELEDQLPSELFDSQWYKEEYPDVEALGIDPLQHYRWLGNRLGRAPNPHAVKDAGASLHTFTAEYLRKQSSEGQSGISGEAGFNPHDMNASTYHNNRPYTFLSDRCLSAISEKYENLRLWNGPLLNDVAFYSCVTGGYDNILSHEHLIHGADYHLFTDNYSSSSETDSRLVPSFYERHNAPYFDRDPVRAARFVKTHPHMLLPDYKIVIWLDGNILIRGDLSYLIARFWESGHPVAAIPHPHRTSVFEEAQECIKRTKDDSGLIEAHVARYAAEGFDCDDLIESNFMMYRLDHPKLAPFLDVWWSEIDRGSRRDQLSFNYAMRKAEASWFPLTERCDSVRNHPDMALLQHRSTTGSIYAPKVHFRTECSASYSDVLRARVEKYADRTVDVIVCVHNAPEAVKRCLASVNENRIPDKHRVVIVDDGSEEETANWLREFVSAEDNTHLIRHEEAAGYTMAANAGLRSSDADMAILLNSDTIVAANWIGKLVDAAFSNPGVGIVGPLSSAASHQSIPDHRSTANQTAINDLPAGYAVSDLDLWCARNSPADFIPRVPLVHGFCFALKREVIEKVGLFDQTNFPFGYGEENDYCFRAVNSGFSLAIATHTYVYHEKSQSYQNDRRIALVKAGNIKIREIHGQERVLRAVENMQNNPHLQRMRILSADLFRRRPNRNSQNALI